MDDVVPAMLQALRRVDPYAASLLERRVGRSRGLGSAGRQGDESDAYAAIYDALQAHVPAGHYVGTDIEGGSDIGVWPLEHSSRGSAESVSPRAWRVRVGAAMSAVLGIGSSVA